MSEGAGADIHAVVKAENVVARAIAESTVSRLWPGVDPKVVPLSGGLTNDVYRVTVPEHDAAIQVQMDVDRSAILQIDRVGQILATRHAADIGIGPAVLSYEDVPPVLVTQFVAGGTFSDLQLDDEILCRAAKSIAVLHASAFDPQWRDHIVNVPAGVRSWIANSRSFYTDLDAVISTAFGILDEAEPLLPDRARVPSHNDLMPGNLIDDGKKTWIIDWEFSGLNVPEHDLANFIRLNGLDQHQSEIFLKAYGPLNAVNRATITIYGVLARLWEASYVLKCGTVGFLDMDHRQFFTEAVASARRIADDVPYRNAVATLAACRR